MLSSQHSTTEIGGQRDRARPLLNRRVFVILESGVRVTIILFIFFFLLHLKCTVYYSLDSKDTHFPLSVHTAQSNLVKIFVFLARQYTATTETCVQRYFNFSGFSLDINISKIRQKPPDHETKLA